MNDTVNMMQGRLYRESGRRVLKGDVLKVIIAIENGWENGTGAAVYNSKLYNRDSPNYCRLLELLFERGA
jgi:hypothetical protein